MDLLNEFLKYIKDHHLVSKGDKVLLAVSGGIDSMVMADLFSRTDIKFGIAHCNFCLRGSDSDGDEELVRKYAVRHNLPFYIRKFDTKNYAARNGISIQMAARELRYSWFEDILRNEGYDTVAIAHNMNDNIETLLINLTRGTGIAGLTGIKPLNNHIIRPLLFVTREGIAGYCNNRKIKFREDKSNAETKYTRNKIRHLVIPVLKEINPSIESTLSDTAERMTGINEIVCRFIDSIRKNIFSESNEDKIVNITMLKPYMPNSTIIFELFRPFGITNGTLIDLYKIMEGRTGGQLLTGSYRIIRNRKEIIISAFPLHDNGIFEAENLEDLKKAFCIKSASIASIKSISDVSHDTSIATLDYNKISFPVLIRRWNPGDSFYPFGMKQKKKLSDYFIDRKYSRIDKEKALIMESGGRIVWIIGERIDDRFRVTTSTKKALVIKALGH